MPNYKVVKVYSKWDTTLNKDDVESIEYPVHPGFIDTLKDARSILAAKAMKEGLYIFDAGLSAKKETISTDEETGITTVEREELRIDIQK